MNQIRFANAVLKSRTYKENELNRWLSVWFDDYFVDGNRERDIFKDINYSLFRVHYKGGIREKVELVDKLNVAGIVMDTFLGYVRKGYTLNKEHLKYFNQFADAFVFRWLEIMEKQQSISLNIEMIKMFKEMRNIIQSDKIRSALDLIINKVEGMKKLDSPMAVEEKELSVSLYKVNKLAMELIIDELDSYRMDDYQKIINFIVKNGREERLLKSVSKTNIELCMLNNYTKHDRVNVSLRKINQAKNFKPFQAQTQKELLLEIREFLIKNELLSEERLYLYDTFMKIEMQEMDCEEKDALIISNIHLVLDKLFATGEDQQGVGQLETTAKTNVLESLWEPWQIVNYFYIDYPVINIKKGVDERYQMSFDGGIEGGYGRSVLYGMHVCQKILSLVNQNELIEGVITRMSDFISLTRKNEISHMHNTKSISKELFWVVFQDKIKRNSFTLDEIDSILENNFSMYVGEYFKEGDERAAFLTIVESFNKYDFSKEEDFLKLYRVMGHTTAGLMEIMEAFQPKLLNEIIQFTDKGKGDNVAHFLKEYFRVSVFIV